MFHKSLFQKMTKTRAWGGSVTIIKTKRHYYYVIYVEKCNYFIKINKIFVVQILFLRLMLGICEF